MNYYNYFHHIFSKLIGFVVIHKQFNDPKSDSTQINGNLIKEIINRGLYRRLVSASVTVHMSS